MREIATVLPPLVNEVFAWLASKGIQPAGAPFWRYLVVDMKGKLEIDVAVPVAVAPPSDKHIVVDFLPAGRYATLLHTGHSEGLQKVTAKLLSWAESKGIGWQMNGGKWGGRVEWYLTDPASEPDMTKWQTELAFLTTKGKEKSQTPLGNRKSNTAKARTGPAARVAVKNVNHPGQTSRVRCDEKGVACDASPEDARPYIRGDVKGSESPSPLRPLSRRSEGCVVDQDCPA